MMCTVMQSDSLYVQTCVIMGQMSLCCTLPSLHFDFILLHLNFMFYIPFLVNWSWGRLGKRPQTISILLLSISRLHASSCIPQKNVHPKINILSCHHLFTFMQYDLFDW